MQQNRAFRVVKGGRRSADERPAEKPAAVAEREMRSVVSGWIAEHERAAAELRVAAVALLRGAGPRAAQRA